MKVTGDIYEIRQYRTSNPGATWGLVPTMGYLHEGHLSLARRAKTENDRVGASIFINPIQFNNVGDLTAYPKNLERDLEMLAAEGVDLVWTPSSEQVYPPDFQTYVDVENITKPLEGTTRPGHFRGVTTVVAKLFNIFQPHKAYFGQKDAQQVQVVKRMVEDLNFPIEVVTCPTIREPDGLAMSSRNARLSADARRTATCLYRALQAAKVAYNMGERDAETLRATMTGIIGEYNYESVDYASVAAPDSLEELDRIDMGALLSLAVIVDDVRLIDNVVVGRSK